MKAIRTSFLASLAAALFSVTPASALPFLNGAVSNFPDNWSVSDGSQATSVATSSGSGDTLTLAFDLADDQTLTYTASTPSDANGTADVVISNAVFTTAYELPGVEAVGGIDSQAAICVYTNTTSGGKLQYYGWAGDYKVENDVTNLTWVALTDATPVEGATNTVTMSFNYTTSPATVTFKVGDTTLTPNPVQLVNNTKAQVTGVSFSGTGSIGEMAGQSAPAAPSTFLVTFYTNDLATASWTTNVPANTVPVYLAAEPTKAPTAEYTYTFAGWTNETVAVATKTLSDPVTAPTNYYAAFTATPVSYTLTWNLDGGTITSEAGMYTAAGQVPFGTALSAPTVTKTGYTFGGWDSEVPQTMPAANETYTAQWTPNANTAYTVKHYFQNLALDGYAQNTTDYPDQSLTGTTAQSTVATAHTVAGFTPKTITQETIAADGSTVVSVYYDRNKYTITWVDGNGNTIETDSDVPYGAMPTYNGATPTKDATAEYTYTFNNSWSPSVGPVTGAQTYTAQFDSTPVSYTLSWVTDGDELTGTYTSGSVPFGTTIVPPNQPTKTGATFKAWNPMVAATMPAANTTYTATWTVDTFTVYWVVNDETVETDNDVAYNTQAHFDGATPTKTSSATTDFNFSGWSDGTTIYAANALPPVTDNVTFTAQFSEVARPYTLAWDAAGGNLSGEYTAAGSVANGAEITAPTATRDGYTFDGWSPEFTGTMPTADTTYVAQWSKIVVPTLALAKPTLSSTVLANAQTGAVVKVTVDPAAEVHATNANVTFTSEGAVTNASFTSLPWNDPVDWMLKSDGAADLPGRFYAKGEKQWFSTNQLATVSDLGEKEMKGVDMSDSPSAAGQMVRIQTALEIPEGAMEELPDSTGVGEARTGFAVARIADNGDTAPAFYAYTGVDAQGVNGWVKLSGATPVANTTNDLLIVLDVEAATARYYVDGIALYSGSAQAPAYAIPMKAFEANETKQINGIGFANPDGVATNVVAEYDVPFEAAVGDVPYAAAADGLAAADKTGVRTLYLLTNDVAGTISLAANESVKVDTAKGSFASAEPVVLADGLSGYEIVSNRVDSLTTYTVQLANYAISYELDGGAWPTGYTATNTYTVESPAITLASPEKTDYNFLGWVGTGLTGTNATVTIASGSTGDRAYTSIWQRAAVTIRFLNYDGSVLQSSDVDIGQTPVYSGETPAKPATAQYSYEWTGWEPVIVAAAAAADYTATFSETLRSYDVTFSWHGDSETTSYEYGQKPTTPTVPASYVENGTIYTFQRWNAEIVSVTGAATYTAVYDEGVTAVATVFTVANNGATTNVVGTYASLAEAVGAAPAGAVVQVLADVALASTVVVDKDLTIDLNGNDIAATDARALWIKSGDVTLDGTGTVSANGEGLAETSSVIRVGDSAANTAAAKLTIGADVTVSSAKSYGVTVFGKNSDGDDATTDIALDVYGTVAVTSTGEADAAISGNGSSGLSAVDVTIRDGAVVSATNQTGIYFPGAGTLSIEGGSITAPTAVYAKAGTVAVSGGTLTATGAKADYQYYGNGPKATGDALVLDNCGYPNGTTFAASITGGTFVSQNAQSVASYAYGADATTQEAREPLADFIPATVDGQPNPARFSDAESDGVPEGYVLTPVEGTSNPVLYEIARAYTIIWVVDDVATTNVVLAGGAVTAPADPTKEFYTFAGWSPAVAATAEADATYVAQWGVVYTATLDKDAYTATGGGLMTMKATIVRADGATLSPADKDGWAVEFDAARFETSGTPSWSKGTVTYKAKRNDAGFDTATGTVTLKRGDRVYDTATISVAPSATWTFTPSGTHMVEGGDLAVSSLKVNGIAVDLADYMVTSDDATLATIDQSGSSATVTPVSAGKATFTLADGNGGKLPLSVTFVDAAAKIGSTFYETVAKAMNAAASGDTVVLCRNVTESVYFSGNTPRVDGFALTIDLAGHTWTGGTSNNPYALRVDYGTITVKDTVGGGGVAYGTDYAFIVSHLAGAYTSKLVLESGAFSGKTSVAQVGMSGGSGSNKKYYGGTLEIRGGTFEAVLDEGETLDPDGHLKYLLNELDFSASAYPGGEYSPSEIVVKGGSFKQFDPANNVAEGAGTSFLPATGYVSVADDPSSGWYTVYEAVTVSFVNDKGAAPEAQVIGKGKTATKPADPAAVAGFRFDGWFAEGAEEAFDFTTPVAADLTLTAKWTPTTATVIWVVEGTRTEETYDIGATPVYPGATPTKAGTDSSVYVFTGWSPALAEVTAEGATYTAQFSLVSLSPASLELYPNCSNYVHVVGAPEGSTYTYKFAGQVGSDSYLSNPPGWSKTEGWAWPYGKQPGGTGTITVTVSNNNAQVAQFVANVTVKDVIAVVDGVEYTTAQFANAVEAAMEGDKVLGVYYWLSSLPKVALGADESIRWKPADNRGKASFWTSAVTVPATTDTDWYKAIASKDAATGITTVTCESQGAPYVKIDDGTTVTYSTSSFPTMSTAGATYTMLRDITRTSAIVTSASGVVLDLNGYTLTLTKGSMNVKGGLTVKDNSEAGTGKIAKTTAAGTDTKLFLVNGGGTVAIKGGTFESAGEILYTDETAGSAATISGGTFSSTAADTAFLLNCSDGNKGAIAVTGGSFQGFDPANNAADGADTDYVATGYVSVANDPSSGWYTVYEAVTVTFADEKVTPPEAQVIGKGKTATEPEDPTFTGWTFEGWFAPEATEAFDFGTAIDADITLTAKWTQNEYDVIWVADGAQFASNRVAHGTAMPVPATNPTRDGDDDALYTFVKWTPAQDATVTSNATYTAEFKTWTKVAVPTAAANLVYTGAEQTGVAAGTGYTLSGHAVGTDAGDYTATASLADDENTVWADATEVNAAATAAKTIEWSIDKAPLSALAVALQGWTENDPANTPSVTGNVGGGTPTITYWSQDGETQLSGQPTAAGTYTVKVSVPETANYLAGEATAIFTIDERGVWTIIWLADDGTTEYGRTQVTDGDMPTPPAATKTDPTGKYEYEFASWSPALAVATEATSYQATFTTKIATSLALPLADHAVDATVNGASATVALAPTGTIASVSYTAVPAAAWSDATMSFAFEGLDWNASTNWTVDAEQGEDPLDETAHNEGVFYAKASTELFTATTNDFVELSDLGVAGVGYSNEVASAAGEAVRVHTTIDVPGEGLTSEPDVGDAKAGFAVLQLANDTKPAFYAYNAGTDGPGTWTKLYGVEPKAGEADYLAVYDFAAAEPAVRYYIDGVPLYAAGANDTKVYAIPLVGMTALSTVAFGSKEMVTDDVVAVQDVSYVAAVGETPYTNIVEALAAVTAADKAEANEVTLSLLKANLDPGATTVALAAGQAVTVDATGGSFAGDAPFVAAGAPAYKVVSAAGAAANTTVYSVALNEATVIWVAEDGTTELFKSNVVIGTVPVYLGAAQTKDATDAALYTWAGWTDAAGALYAGTLPAVAVGGTNYTATFKTWTKVALPQVASGLVYNGKEQTGATVGASATLSGTAVGTAAGSYTATATLADAENTVWADDTAAPTANADRILNWSIAPKSLTLTWGATSFVADGTAKVPTATLDGVVEGDDVTAEVSGAQTAAGTYTATATLAGADKANYALSGATTTAFEISAAAATVFTVADNGDGTANTNDVAYYATFADAVARAAAGQTVALLDDVALASTVVVDKDLTIDLNGNNIAATDARALWIKSGDVTLAGAGTVSATGAGLVESSSVVRVGDGAANAAAAKLTIGKDVTVSTDKSYGVTVFGKNTAGIELVVNGTVAVTSTGDADAAISGNGSKGLSPVSITVNEGATVTSESTTGIYFPGEGTLTVNGGTVSGADGIEMRAGSLAVTGGSIAATGTFSEPTANGNGTTGNGGVAVLVSQHSTDKAISVAVSGGTLTGPKAFYETDTVASETPSAGVTATIAGGTIDGAVETANLATVIPGDSAALFKDANSDGVAEGYYLVASETEPGFYEVSPRKSVIGTTITVAEDAVYDGATQDANMALVVKATADGATLSPDTDYVATFATNALVNAGGYEVTITGIGAWIDTTNVTFTVAKRPATFTAASDTKTYDGSALVKHDFTSEGLVAGHTATATVTGSQTDVGASANKVSQAVVLDGQNNDVTANYEFTYVDGELKVTPAAMAITIAGVDSTAVYTGSEQTTNVAWTATSETVGFVPTKVSYTGDVSVAGTTVGDYAYYLDATKFVYADDNFTATFTVDPDGKFTVTKADLSVTAKPKTVTYGDAPANDGVDYSGFVNGEAESVLGGTLAYEYTYEQFGNVGSYKITPSGLTSDNYEISFVEGALTVEAKEVGLTWSPDPATFTYDGTAKVPTATATGLVNNDVISVTVTGEQTKAGTGYTATATALTGDKAGNYKLPTDATQAFSITAATITITVAENQSKTYGADDPVLAYTATLGDVPYEGSITGALARVAGEDVGTYAITAGTIGAADPNYVVSVTEGVDFTITAATVDIPAAPGNKVYTSEVLKADVSSADTYTVTNEGGTNVGDYTVVFALKDTTNYTWSDGSITNQVFGWSITKAPLTLTADDKTVAHGAAAPAYTYTPTGLLGSDTLATEPTLSCAYAAGNAVGTYPITIADAVAPNYAITYANGTLTVVSNTFTVIWLADDGTTEIDTTQVEWGETPTHADATKTDATGKYAYEFAAWTPAPGPVTEATNFVASFVTTIKTPLALAVADEKLASTAVSPVAKTATVAADLIGAVEGVTVTEASGATVTIDEATATASFSGLAWNQGVEWTMTASQTAEDDAKTAESAELPGKFYVKPETAWFTATADSLAAVADGSDAAVCYTAQEASNEGEMVRVHTTVEVPAGGLPQQPATGTAKVGFAVLQLENDTAPAYYAYGNGTWTKLAGVEPKAGTVDYLAVYDLAAETPTARYYIDGVALYAEGEGGAKTYALPLGNDVTSLKSISFASKEMVKSDIVAEQDVSYVAAVDQTPYTEISDALAAAGTAGAKTLALLKAGVPLDPAVSLGSGEKLVVDYAKGTFTNDVPVVSGVTGYDVKVTEADTVKTYELDPIVYPIEWILNGGVNAAENTNEYTVAILPITYADATRTGYTFDGWTNALGAKVTGIAAGTTGSVTNYASWTPALVNYTVKHFQANVDGTYPAEPTESETLQGYTEAQTEAVAKTYAGFTAGTVTQATIAADGSTVVEIKYDRKSFVLTIAYQTPEGTTAPETYTETLVYGAAYSVESPAVVGHTPDKATVSGTMGAAPVNETVTYTVNQFTITIAYVTPAGVTAPETYTAQVAYGSSYSVESPAVAGYTPDPATVAGTMGTEDVSVEVTYTATVYNITYDLDGGSVAEGANPATYTIETADFTLVNPTKDGYTFAGWTGTGLDAASTEVTIAKGSTGDREYTATWTKNTVTVISVADGTTTSYPTLADALAAAGAGETVRLLEDVEEEAVALDKAITLDLNGHTWTVPTERDEEGYLTTEPIAITAAVVVTDSSGNGGGSIESIASPAVRVAGTGASLTVEEGATIASTDGDGGFGGDAVEVDAGGAIVVDGGTVKGTVAVAEDATGAGVTVKAGSVDEIYVNDGATATVAVTGGEVVDGIIAVDDDQTAGATKATVTVAGGSVGGGVQIPAGSTLEVSDGTVDGISGEGDVTVSGGTVNDGIVSAGTVTVTGGTVNPHEAAGGVTPPAIVAGGTATISGGTVGGDVKAIDGGDVTVSDPATVTGGVSAAGDGSTVAVEGGTVSGGVSVAEGGDATVTGGTVAGGVSATGEGSTVEVEGGTVNGQLAAGEGDGSSIAVSGGHFDNDPSAYVADGYVAVPNTTDGGYDVTARKSVIGTTITVAGGTYNGQAYEIGSVVLGDYTLTASDFTVVYTNVIDGVATNDNVNAGTVTATITGIGEWIDTTNVTFTIAKAALTITADDITVPFRTPADAIDFTFTYDGFENGDTTNVLTARATATLDPAYDPATAAAGDTFDIVPSGAAAANYYFSYVKGRLTIGDAEAPTMLATTSIAVDGTTVTLQHRLQTGAKYYTYFTATSLTNGWKAAAASRTLDQLTTVDVEPEEGEPYTAGKWIFENVTDAVRFYQVGYSSVPYAAGDAMGLKPAGGEGEGGNAQP